MPRWGVVVALASVIGCGGDDTASVIDGAPFDAMRDGPTLIDAPAVDAPAVDAPAADATMPDAEMPDAGPQSCSTGGQCATGFCFDGVCCDVDCSGPCRACNLAGAVGTCTAYSGGTDPENECADQGAGSCGTDGFCNGAGACRLYSSQTQCQAATCVGPTTAQAARSCDGTGTCVAGSQQACSPFVCTGGACRTSCTSGADCASGFDCAGGLCKKTNGQNCSLGSECVSGQCVDGVCCNVACSGTCRACNLAGAVGTCTVYSAGTDPENECAAQSASSCGLDGFCDGGGNCQLYPLGTQCVAPACVTATASQNSGQCNGTGSCVAGSIIDCTPYLCTASTGLCKTSCSSNGDCATGFGCQLSSGQCKKLDGVGCLGNGECLDNACCSGVCRNLSNDLGNCGSCGTTCTNACGTTSCSGGACAPVCGTGCGNCDGNNTNGCETSTRTNTNCNGCGIPCSLSNASSSCSTGACTVTSCNSGFANCDGNDNNGCERNLMAYNNTCAGATELGDHCGDLSCGFLCPAAGRQLQVSQSGTTSSFFHAHLGRCGGCSAMLQTVVMLQVPASVDYDLYVYASCGGTLIGSSTLGVGQTDQVTVSDASTSDAGIDYWIEVRYFGGTACSPWTLTINGSSCGP